MQNTIYNRITGMPDSKQAHYHLRKLLLITFELFANEIEENGSLNETRNTS